MLAVGIPREIKVGERRVSLTPKGVRVLTENQIPVYVEKGAGLGSGFQDEDYKRAGAEIVEDSTDLWKQATLIKKVKEPIVSEYPLFEPRHLIFTYFHLASPSNRPLLEALIQAKTTAMAYETIEQDGDTPLLKPMSEVAGVLAAYFAGIFHSRIRVQEKKILGLGDAKAMMEDLSRSYPSVPKNLRLGRVVILGGGHVGFQAARMACQMGGRVALSEISENRRNELREIFQSLNLKIEITNPQDLSAYEHFLEESEVIIAAVHVPGRRAPLIIDLALLRKISRRRKIVLDIAIDQGGNVAESRPADYENPLYLDSLANLRFSVTNMPSLCGRGASVALEEASLEYTKALAGGLDSALKAYPELQSGFNVHNGVVVHPAVRESYGLN